MVVTMSLTMTMKTKISTTREGRKEIYNRRAQGNIRQKGARKHKMEGRKKIYHERAHEDIRRKGTYGSKTSSQCHKSNHSRSRHECSKSPSVGSNRLQFIELHVISWYTKIALNGSRMKRSIYLLFRTKNKERALPAYLLLRQHSTCRTCTTHTYLP